MKDAGRAPIVSIGAGRMGRGIAHAFAYAGYDVRLIDAKERHPAEFALLREKALAEIRGSLSLLAALGQFDAQHVETILGRVSVHPREEAASHCSAAEFVFEGVPETSEAKSQALAWIDDVVSESAIVASTTSTFLSTLLAGMTRRPRQFLNAHWLNPAYLVPLVEVSPHPDTEARVTDRLIALLEGIGKVPVLCRASPGYIVPRIQALAMNEAARLVEEGVASPEAIDKAVLYGFGFRFAVLGLVEFIDWGGGDILAYASRYLAEATGDQRFAAPKIVEEKMAKGEIGMKTNRGFYDWAGRDVEAFRREKLAGFLAILREMGKKRPPVL